MRRNIGIYVICLLCLTADAQTSRPATQPEIHTTLYNADVNHPWNRLQALLFARAAPDGKVFGLDEVDPLYWPQTTHLLTSPSHEAALRALDDFLTNKQ